MRWAILNILILKGGVQANYEYQFVVLGALVLE